MSEIERDRELDAAWRAASRDEPPPALDAAIRAEARRAVGAVPGGRRNKHWWYPFAAAATVAVLAIGIARMTPPEQVTATVVAEESAASREAVNGASHQAAPADTTLAAPPAAPAQAPPQREALTREPRVAAGVIERERAAAPAAMAKKQAPQAKDEGVMREQLAAAQSEKPEPNAAPAASAAPPAPAAPRSEPFPANAPPPEARRDAYAEVPRPATSPSAASAPARSAPAGAATPQASRPAGEEAQVNRLAMGKVAKLDEAKTKDADGRSVEDWIKRIRELKSEGRLDDATKELAAFRAAFGERADALLPSDLRTWAASGVAAGAK